MEKQKKDIISSPFEFQRKEREGDKLPIFVNYTSYDNWISANNCLIKGSRGTGKSSVLSTLAYNVRWLNPELIKYSQRYHSLQHDTENLIEKAPIGLLFRCDKVEVNMWNRWEMMNEQDNGLLFSTYIYYFFVKKILQALLDISDKFKLNWSSLMDSGEFVYSAYRKCFSKPQIAPSLYDCSIRGLLSLLDEMCIMIRHNVYCMIPKEIIDKNQCYFSPQSNSLAEFCEFLSEHLYQLKNHLFFMLFDDVDRLNDWQMKVLNTFVKVGTAPCFFKFSSTKDCASRTTIDNVSISATDLLEYRLNDEDVFGTQNNKNRIDELYDAIFRMRLETVGIKYEKDLRSLFGTVNIEQIVKKMLSASKNTEVIELLNECDGKNITDVWLVKQGILSGSRITTKTFDKYRVNASFAIASEYNLKKGYVYYSYDIIRALCCGSPRHFLQICNAMWPDIYACVISGKEVIIPTKQNKAIREVSNNICKNLDTQPIDASLSISYKDVIKRLANLFAILTTNKHSLKISPECMSIEFEDAELDKVKTEKLTKVLDHLLMVEAIKIMSKTPGMTTLALNPMLAPEFCLPYRSPFMNSCRVNICQLFSYLFNSKETSPEKVIQKRFGSQQTLKFDL